MDRYYRLTFDPEDEDLWILDDPLSTAGEEIAGWNFTVGKQQATYGRLKVPVYRPGKVTAFSFNVSNVPIVCQQLMDVLESVLEESIQRIPVDIDSIDESYEILNVLDVVDCVDEERSDFTKWSEADARPDKLGQYRSIPVMKIDPVRAATHKMFRIKGWHVDLIVNEEIKTLLKVNRIVGLAFRDVS